MKKSIFLLVAFMMTTLSAFAEEVVIETQTPSTETVTAPAVPVEVPVEAQAPAPVVAEPVASPALEVAPPVAPVASVVTPEVETVDLENLEFVSGEVSSMDETAKTVTVKLYGEAEDGKSDKVLTVKIDDTTDITDGEKDRDLKSLTAGIEVDVEYDPATNKATYIFVY